MFNVENSTLIILGLIFIVLNIVSNFLFFKLSLRGEIYSALEAYDRYMADIIYEEEQNSKDRP